MKLISRDSRFFWSLAPLAHLAVAACLVVVPTSFWGPPSIWRQPTSNLIVAGSLALVYLATALVLSRIATARGFASVERTMLVWAIAFGLWWALVSVPPPVEVVVGCGVFGLFGLFVTQSFAFGRLAVLGIAAIVFCAGVSAHLAYKFRLLPRPVAPSMTTSVVDTSLYQLQVTKFSDSLPKDKRYGGGIAPWGERYLIATGSGELFLVAAAADSMKVEKLPHAIPLNVDEFEEGGRKVFAKFKRQYVESSRFRVGGILVHDIGDTRRLYASHHFWKDDQQCFVLRVSYLEGPPEQLEKSAKALEWRTLYETTPCLKLNTEGPRGVRFEGLENGGRMAMLSPNEMLLTVGDHGFDGYNRSPALAQDPNNSYGKILRIQLDTGQAQVYSLGHRNPQGLYIDARGAVWSDEHGPRGGDELNLIQPGADYGWPQNAYGTDYSLHHWPLNPTPGRHDAFQKPVYAFVPSVGVSSLIGAGGKLFDLWKDDLLIGSLREQTIWRAHVENGHVLFMEPIRLSNRIRDMMIDYAGRVVVWTDESDVLFIEPAHSQSGDALVSQCTGCHSLSPWDPAFLAPTLSSVVGRKVASQPDFDYSEAMKEFGGRWTKKRLDAFLANPEAAVPGTLMQYPGIQDPDQRAKLIAYLERLVPVE